MTKRTMLSTLHVTDDSGLGLQVWRGALDHEASAPHRELKGSGCWDRFEPLPRWAAEPHDLLCALREVKPTVIHFSGHGDQDGQLFQRKHGEARRVSVAAIEETSHATGDSIRLIVLSACSSRVPSEAWTDWRRRR
jgi:hypothetical protein